jgi:signal transduction histidine kinase
MVATPNSGDVLSSRDTRLLERLAPQLAIALRVSTLNQALQGSRERLVNALEEERRRLRRDLHDGLGPVLTAAGLRADAARNLLERDPMAAERQLVELREELTAAIGEVRRLVYGLRPPALDELGLVGALRDQANSLVNDSQAQGDGMRVDVLAPDRLRPLPAAVEVAAFRIALEALTNAARHAQARNCVVALSVNGALQIDVRDDGAGLGATIKPGFGLTSMRERVAELGGTLDVTSVQGEGTHIIARLPLEAGPA